MRAKQHGWSLFTLILCAAACGALFLQGCGQTGRTQSLANTFRECVFHVNTTPAGTNNTDFVLNPAGSAQGGVVFNAAHMWTDTSGTEEGTGRNTTPVTTTATLPANTAAAALGTLSADALAAGLKRLDAGNAGGAGATGDCADGDCGEAP